MLREDASSMNTVPDRELLPTNVVPTHYDVVLEPDLEKFTYWGTVDIDLDVKEDSNSISLNTIDIDVKNASIHSASGLATDSLKHSYDEDTQTATFSFDETLKAGTKSKLHIEFTGILNDNMVGFYRSSYNDEKGNKKFMATTQMEPTDCRRAFPCWDEPAIKSTFGITLISDEHLTCLSNMDEKSTAKVDSKLGNGKKKAVTFNPTPLMSTYLVAFIVGELKVVESDHFRVPVRVYAPPDQDIEHGRFSVELAARTLAFYEKEFDSEFPLPKMDMVAIPDFSAGAMENWGLVTYRVVDVLFDPKKSGASVKKRVAETVQHELAHQWFGNLVTMDFWDGLWLNEGFATWMSWYSCNVFYPEWKVWQSYVTDDLQGALALDSLRSSHPIDVPIKRADEVNQIFDAISYSKGSCIIRMISKYVGEQTFLEGIRTYLKRHAYGNTKTSDLWAALSEASGKDIAKVMDIWTKNVGYPVVTVTEDEKSNSINVKQNRYLRTGDVKPEEDKTLYPVFLGLRTKKGTDEDVTLMKREDTFELPDLDFFKLNADHSSVYRTFYSPSRLSKLGQAAKEGKLTVEDRAGMIADASSLSASGHQPTSGTLSLLKEFHSEPEYIVWSEVASSVASVRSAWTFEDQTTKDALKALTRSIVSKKAHALGWEFKENEDSIQQEFKALMFASAGIAGDEQIVAAAQSMFEKLRQGDREAIHPNIRGAVYNIVLANGGEREYDTIVNEFRAAKTADERNTALRALGRAKDPKLIQRTIDLAIGDEVRSQDIYMPLGSLRTHPEGIVALFEALQKHYDLFVKRLSQGTSIFGSVVQLCISSFTHKDQLAKVEKFFAGKNTKGFDQTLAQGLDSIRAKSRWVERDGKDVSDWLKQNGYYQS